MTREQIRVEVRKLRKKLRQIENLERLDRELNDEEIIKVLRKNDLRSELLDLLSQLPIDGDMSWDSLPASQCDTSAGGGDDDSNLHLSSTYGDQDVSQPVDGPNNGFYNNDVEEEQEEYDIDNENDAEDVVSPTSDPVTQTEKRHSPQPQKRHLPDETGDNEETSKYSKPVTPPKKRKDGSSASGDSAKKEDAVKQKTKAVKLSAQKSWRNMRFSVEELCGHNDLVTSVDMDSSLIVTASRDTTVKLWSTVAGVWQEQRSLGGHTMSVTCVHLLSEQQTNRLAAAMEHDAEGGRYVLSSSHDCHFKLWASATGQQVQSIYTYNPVLSLAYIEQQNLVVTGSDGGKLELWSLVTGTQVQSLRTAEDAISHIQVEGVNVYCACADGLIRIYELRGGTALHLVYVSENIKMSSGQLLLNRPIRSLAVRNGVVFFGDDGMNVKVVDWKKGVAAKLSNHTTEFGATDALTCCHDDLLLASGYDLDNGVGYINVRSLPDQQYGASLTEADGGSGRIIAMAAIRDVERRLKIVTGGMSLKVWTQLPSNASEPNTDAAVISPYFVPQYDRSPRNSDLDDSDTDAWSENEAPEQQRRHGNRQEVETTGSGWGSWCRIL